MTMFFLRGTEYAHTRLRPSKKLYFQPDILNNRNWLKDLNFLEFLRTAGVHVRINTMLARERLGIRFVLCRTFIYFTYSVRSRLDSQKGISFTEFTYQLLQAYDFFHLYKTRECSIQVGGSDQWGNILAGLEMINRENMGPMPGPRLVEEKGFGITTPLLTTASGQKFGKSAGNAVWLDEQLTSVFDFYQVCCNFHGLCRVGSND